MNPPQKPDFRRSLGRWGEDIAASALTAQGMAILARNVRCRTGELDIIARDGDTLVVCEVKTRRHLRQGDPIESITPRKLRTMRSVLLHWMAEEAIYAPCIRFDGFGITVLPDGRPVVRHVRGLQP